MNPRQWLESRWYSGRAPLLLLPLSLLYRLVVAMRRAAYRGGLLPSGHPGAPVIVVGNITVGGTGKTPLVLWLAGQMMASGWRVGIVCRGHGGKHVARAGRARLVSAADDAVETGDEALLLAREAGCPVAMGADRLEAAKLLVAQGCSLIIADDGLQHLGLRRDVEIAVVDGERRVGNGNLLPAGPLREPAGRLREVDAVVVNGAAGDPLPAAQVFAMHLQPLELISLAGGEAMPLAQWRGRQVHAVAGIGNPQRFFATLRALGMHPLQHPFPDHHPFRAGDLSFGDARDIVMTAKDAVKCHAFVTGRMWYLRVAAQFEQEDAARLLQWLETRLAGKHPAGKQ